MRRSNREGYEDGNDFCVETCITEDFTHFSLLEIFVMLWQALITLKLSISKAKKPQNESTGIFSI